MRPIIRIRYETNSEGYTISEPILYGGRWVEIKIIDGGGQLCVIDDGTVLAQFKSRNLRNVKAQARQYLAGNGASLGEEVRKRL